MDSYKYIFTLDERHIFSMDSGRFSRRSCASSGKDIKISY